MDDPVPRLAVPADAPRISALMRASAAALFPSTYDAEQTASGVEHIAHLDPVLLADGTFFVVEEAGELVAGGGWSRRAKLYAGGVPGDDLRLLDPATEAARIRSMFVRGDRTRRGLGRAVLAAGEAAARAEGFRELVLMATMPGVPLYRAYGFEEVERVDITLPDGVVVVGAVMTRPIR